MSLTSAQPDVNVFPAAINAESVPAANDDWGCTRSSSFRSASASGATYRLHLATADRHAHEYESVWSASRPTATTTDLPIILGASADGFPPASDDRFQSFPTKYAIPSVHWDAFWWTDHGRAPEHESVSDSTYRAAKLPAELESVPNITIRSAVCPSSARWPAFLSLLQFLHWCTNAQLERSNNRPTVRAACIISRDVIGTPALCNSAAHGPGHLFLTTAGSACEDAPDWLTESVRPARHASAARAETANAYGDRDGLRQPEQRRVTRTVTAIAAGHADGNVPWPGKLWIQFLGTDQWQHESELAKCECEWLTYGQHCLVVRAWEQRLVQAGLNVHLPSHFSADV